MLRPEEREDPELEVVGLATQETPDTVVLVFRQAERTMERLCGDDVQDDPTLTPVPDLDG
jgi:hypothetical protein